MLYCKDTNTPLTPMFLKKLAIAYKTNIETYKQTLQQILADQCVVDGDKLIDEHTGYVITNQEFDVDEGYDDTGFKVNTKSQLDIDEVEDGEKYDNIKDTSDLISEEKTQNNEMDNNQEFQDVENVFSSMMIDETLDEPIQHSYTSIVISIFQEYEKTLNLNFFNKPKTMSYIFQYFDKNKDEDGDQILGLTVITLCFIILELQMQFHKLHIRSIEGNCKPFLKGFPIFHESDTKTIRFVLCLAKQLNLNKNLNAIEMDTLVDEIQKELQEIVMTTMRMQINEFLENYKNNSNIVITTNMRFLPNLRKVKMPTYKTLQKQIDKSSKILSFDDYILYSSKLHELSYYIQEEVQGVTSKQEPLLRGRTIYTENFCCLENNNYKNPYDYFVNKSTLLETYNKHAIEIQTYINMHTKCKKSNLYYDNNNTRDNNMNINYHFSDDVLRNALETLNIEFSSDQVKVYVQNIHQKNLLELPVLNSSSKSTQFESLLNEMMTVDKEERGELKLKLESDISKFIDKYYKLVANHDLNLLSKMDSKENLLIQKDIFDFKLYLLEQINLMKSNINNNIQLNQRNRSSHIHSRNPSKEKFDVFTNEFLDKKNKLSRFQCTNIIKCFQYFNKILISYFYEPLTNGSYHPNDYSIPKHWNFHEEHNLDLLKSHEKNYKNMKNMYNVKTLEELLNSYESYYDNIKWFIQNNQMNIDNDKMINMYIQIYLFYVLHNELLLLLESINDAQMKQDGKHFLNNLLELCSLRLENVYIDKRYIEKKIVQSKEMEKNRITNELFELTDEERETYLMMKKHKLGRTGKGLSKSIFKYVGEEYVANRDLFVEAEERENNDISTMNEDYEMT